MRPALIKLLECPGCGGDLALLPEEREGEEVMTGTLRCDSCAAAFAIVRGVPRMNTAMEGLEQVADAFSFEWKAHHRGRLEHDTLFGLTLEEDWSYFLRATGVKEHEIDEMLVLDAGCGSGRLTRQIGERGATVLGVDINEAVDEAYDFCRDLPNVHILQANVFALPLKRQAFDLVWSQGVIHHTPDARGAHAALSALVRSGGTLYVWVYAKRFNPFRFTKDVLDAARVTRLPPSFLLRLSKVFSYISMPLLFGYRVVRRVPGLHPRTSWGERTVRPRTLEELHLTWLDALSPEYDSRHTEEEVIAWFRDNGFDHIVAIDEPKVGVRGNRGL